MTIGILTKKLLFLPCEVRQSSCVYFLNTIGHTQKCTPPSRQSPLESTSMWMVCEWHLCSHPSLLLSITPGELIHMPEEGTEYWLHSCCLWACFPTLGYWEALWSRIALAEPRTTNIYGITRHKLLGIANWNNQQTLWWKDAGHEATWEWSKLVLLCFVIKCP